MPSTTLPIVVTIPPVQPSFHQTVVFDSHFLPNTPGWLSHVSTIIPSEFSSGATQEAGMNCLADNSLQIFPDPVARFMWRYVFPVQFTLGVLGNTLNLWVLTSNDIPSNIANDLLAAVSLCDLAFLFAMSPHCLAAFDTIAFSRNFRLFYLQTNVHFAAFANWMSAAAIWLILAVSTERLLVVRNPLRSKMYWRGARRACVLGVLFITTGALTLYHHFEFDCEIVEFCNGSQIFEFCYPASESHPTRYGSDTMSNPLPSTRFYMKASTFFNAVLVVFIPIVIVILMNIGLLRTLRLRSAELESGSEQLAAERMKRTTSRVTATVIAIALCFSLTQGPSAVMSLWELFSGYRPANDVFYTVFSLTNALVVTGKTTNFILFCLSSAYFRSKCIGLTFRKFPRLQSSGIGQRLTELTASQNPRGSIRTIRSARRESVPFIPRLDTRIEEDEKGEREQESSPSPNDRLTASAPSSPI